MVALAWLGGTMAVLILGATSDRPVLSATLSPLAGLAAAFYADRRVAPKAKPLSWALPSGVVVLLGGLAAVGAFILASELNNIADSLAPPAPPQPGEAPTVDPWVVVGVVGISLLTISVVFNGIIGRHLLGRLKTSAFVPALGIWASMMASGVGHPVSLVAPLFALGAWIFARTRSTLAALVTALPLPVMLALSALGWEPGIDGFDVLSPDRVLYQPVWFDLLGAALLAGGVAGLIYWFDRGKQGEPS